MLNSSVKTVGSRSCCGFLRPATLALLVWVLAGVANAAPIKLTLSPTAQDRRFIVAQFRIAVDRLAAPYQLRDTDSGKAVACQWEADGKDQVVSWVVPALAAGAAGHYELDSGPAVTTGGVKLADDPGGWLNITAGDRLITKFVFGPLAEKFKKPYFYPIMVNGVSATRGFPMEVLPGEANDHPHHTSVYFGHGEVNGKDYWSNPAKAPAPVTFKRLVNKQSGPVYARLVAENQWGKELTETQDVRLIDAGQDVIMDWAITLRAGDTPVDLGKTKEGGFAVRVATGLTDKGGGAMVDADGNIGEPAVRAKAAVWADNYGKVAGKTIGIAIMNHPTSWRFPTRWHVRGYGLFAANAFFEEGAGPKQGQYILKPNEAITLRYRLFCHGGDPVQAKVKEVYAGYSVVEVKE